MAVKAVGTPEGSSHIELSAEETEQLQAREKEGIDAAVAYQKVKYKDDRKKAYGDIGDQLDMIFKDQLNGTTIWKDHIESVKAAHPKG